MDKFRLVFQFLQTNEESFLNGACGLLALASAQLYSAFEFSCPCLPGHNLPYGLTVLAVPPLLFLLLGFVLNNSVSALVEEWRRPRGQRARDRGVLRYMLCSLLQRALVAPAAWISFSLLDGKSVVCAFSERLDLRSLDVNDSALPAAPADLRRLVAALPCPELSPQTAAVSREAARRYLRCLSQMLGWIFLLLITALAFLVRALRPCFSQVAFLKTRYWSHYLDIERKLFEETCREHARGFARVCVQRFFLEMGDELSRGCGPHLPPDPRAESDSQPKLFGITDGEAMNKLLRDWHIHKPPLNVAPAPRVDARPGGPDLQLPVAKINNGSQVRWEKVVFCSKV
ncbi:calcium homeostasis modulator protein 1 [Leucoraja erinacea]|uniref:calcium homeostasis modulator protein 1 n=1 Tax=Leucoraja erinaceus TaxID=7782 RepID=UPI0024537A55|nr:calcium homeostasis modulator protein 1 [Leucoraja erinacea]